MHRKHSWKICELPEAWFRTVYFNLHTVLVIIIHSVAYNESIPVLSSIPHVHPRTVQHAICRAALETFPLHQERTLLLWLHITRGRALEEARSGGGSAWDAPYNLSNLVCSDHAGGGMKSKKELSVWRKGMGPSCTWQMAELFTANTSPVKLEFFWSRFFHGQIVVSYHTICICWCKHVWTQGHLCSLLVSSALPFLWD